MQRETQSVMLPTMGSSEPDTHRVGICCTNTVKVCAQLQFIMNIIPFLFLVNLYHVILLF